MIVILILWMMDVFFFFPVAGEVSLPGGKAEEDDKDDGITATREAEEEIGLDPSLVDVVAFLEPFPSQVLKKCSIFLLLSRWFSFHKECMFVSKSDRVTVDCWADLCGLSAEAIFLVISGSL